MNTEALSKSVEDMKAAHDKAVQERRDACLGEPAPSFRRRKKPKRFEGDGGPPFSPRSKAVAFNVTVGEAQIEVKCRSRYCGRCKHERVWGSDLGEHQAFCELFEKYLWFGRYGTARITMCYEAEKLSLGLHSTPAA